MRDMDKTCLHVSVSQALQLIAGYIDRTERCQAFFSVAAMLRQVFGNQCFEQFPLFLVDRLLPKEDGAERRAFLKHPSVHRGDQLLAGDKVHWGARMPNRRL